MSKMPGKGLHLTCRRPLAVAVSVEVILLFIRISPPVWPGLPV